VTPCRWCNAPVTPYPCDQCPACITRIDDECPKCHEKKRHSREGGPGCVPLIPRFLPGRPDVCAYDDENPWQSNAVSDMEDSDDAR